jgi:hypothetical protein
MAERGTVIVLGDFNQFMPRVWGPKRSHELMEEAFAGYSIVTSGEIEGLGARAIDHVAFAGNLHATSVFGRSCGVRAMGETIRSFWGLCGLRVDVPKSVLTGCTAACRNYSALSGVSPIV